MVVNHGLPEITFVRVALTRRSSLRINALASVRPNDGAFYKALEVTVATLDFIAAPRRISLASFHSVRSSGTPEEVWI